MNRFINKILKEAKEDDPFFKPKNIKNRKDPIQVKKQKVFLKVKESLKNLKHLKNGLNKKSSMYFIFTIFEKYKVMDSKIKSESFFLVDENNKRRVNISAEREKIYVSHKYISTPIYNFFRQHGYDVNNSKNETEDRLWKLFNNDLKVPGYSIHFGYMITKNSLEESENDPFFQPRNMNDREEKFKEYIKRILKEKNINACADYLKSCYFGQNSNFDEDDLNESESSGNEYESSYDMKKKNNNMYNPNKIYDDFYEKENTNEKSHEIWVTP